VIENLWILDFLFVNFFSPVVKRRQLRRQIKPCRKLGRTCGNRY